MGRVGQELDIKSQLVSEICSISSSSVACTHRHLHSLIKSPFVDWYRVLGVEENADLDVIRKQYHKLALQLHPDKNKHPKAEIAFKLISEAYTCLSDNARRRAFNLERWRNFCIECNKIPYTTTCSAPITSLKLNKWNSTNWSRSYRSLQGLKDLRDRFEEEARVIQNCLRSRASSRQESPLFNPSDYLFQSNTQHKTRQESPIFNPPDYCLQGYPHLRSRIYKKPENFLFLQRGNKLNEWGKGRFDSPIFENSSERQMYKSKYACFHS